MPEIQNEQKPVTEETAKRLIDVLANGPKNATARSVEMAKKPVYTIRNNQLIAGLVGTAGLIIFALGVENWVSTIPQLSSPLILVGIGLFLLAISGLFLKKLG